MADDTNRFPEKGLVADLGATGQKIAELTSRAMTVDELPEETVDQFERLVKGAVLTLSSIHECRNRD